MRNIRDLRKIEKFKRRPGKLTALMTDESQLSIVDDAEPLRNSPPTELTEILNASDLSNGKFESKSVQTPLTAAIRPRPLPRFHESWIKEYSQMSSYRLDLKM
jgi:hypothetical protein